MLFECFPFVDGFLGCLNVFLLFLLQNMVVCEHMHVENDALSSLFYL